MDGLLAEFDRRLRREPAAGGGTVERERDVIRVLSAAPDGWSGVVWSDLDGPTADAAIARERARFAGLTHPWEWKYYDYDRPDDLPERLAAAGFAPEPPEAVLVAETARVPTEVDLPAGVRLVPVVDRPGVEALVRVHDEAFGGDHSGLGRALAAQLAGAPDSVAAVLAVAGDRPVCAGRIEFHPGTGFASLWGGGTIPDWRGRGLFRAVVAHRVGLAAERGARLLQVDASAGSEPILRRMGFERIATTVPFRYPAGVAEPATAVSRDRWISP